MFNQPIGNLVLIPANVSLIRIDANDSISETITTLKPINAILLEEVGNFRRIYINNEFWLVDRKDIYGEDKC